MPITHAVHRVTSNTLPWFLVWFVLILIDMRLNWGSFLVDHDLGGLDSFGVFRLVENFSGAYPVDLHHFASGQVGCVKLVRTRLSHIEAMICVGDWRLDVQSCFFVPDGHLEKPGVLYLLIVRSAAVRGSSNVSTPRTPELYQISPALKPAASVSGFIISCRRFLCVYRGRDIELRCRGRVQRRNSFARHDAQTSP